MIKDFHTIWLIFDTFHLDLPPIPVNLTFEERREGRALHMSWILPSSNHTYPGIPVFVLEQRNTTSQKPVWNDRNIPWTTVNIVSYCTILTYNLQPRKSNSYLYDRLYYRYHCCMCFNAYKILCPPSQDIFHDVPFCCNC